MEPRTQGGGRPRNRLATLDAACVATERLWLVEGAKKALAVAQLGLAAVGFEGIEGWHRGRAVTTLLADFDLIPLAGRLIELVLDGDVETNSAVQGGAARLADALRARGARPRLVRLPTATETRRMKPSKVGADDFIVQTGVTAADLDGLPRQALAPEHRDLTEDALALEFSQQHAEQVAYVHEWRRWLAWDGMRWAEERTLDVFNLSRTLCREASGRATQRALAAKIESAATVSAIVSLARADRRHARLAAHFDRDPWLLNSPAGTIELRTGRLRAHQRTDGVTKVTAVSPKAGTPARWLHCLKTWTQDDDALTAFLQRLTGYFLTGSVREEVLPIIHGPGGNGKTKFVETIRGCLGPDYTTNVVMETLIVTRGEQHPPISPTSAESGSPSRSRPKRDAISGPPSGTVRRGGVLLVAAG